MFLSGILSFIIIVLVLFELIFNPNSFDFCMMISTALWSLRILPRPLAATHTSSAKMKRSTPGGSSSVTMFSINILYRKGLSIPP